MKKTYLVGLILGFVFIIGCGGGGGSGGGGSTDIPVDITLLDGYIINATMSDNSDTPVKFQSDSNVYHFYDTPQGAIKASGGTFLGSGLENKMSFSVSPDVTVITPVVVFLEEYPDLSTTLAIAMNVNVNMLKVDYIKYNSLEIAKFAQMVYAMYVNDLEGTFATNLQNVENFDGILLAAIKSTQGTSNEARTNSFLYALEDLNDVANIESAIYQKKFLMQEKVESPDTDSGSSTGSVYSGLNVKSVDEIGNLKLQVKFNESVNISSDEEKAAFSLRGVKHSNVDVNLTDGKQISISAKSVTIPLSSALDASNEANTYTVSVDSLVSSNGVSLVDNEVKITPYPENLILENIEYVDAKTIKATFNLALDSSSIKTSDFEVSSSKVSYAASSVSIDSSDTTSLIIRLGNSLSLGLGYDLKISSENLTSSADEKKLTSDINEEFTASVSEDKDSNSGFSLESATVDEAGTSLILNFSQDISTNVTQDMFSITLDALQEPIDINVSKDSITTGLVNITIPNVENKMLSPDQNYSYILGIKKQSFYSTDGQRTLGSSYEKEFDVSVYPKVTSATISASTIGFSFNMSMDLNSTDVSVKGSQTTPSITFSGSGANYAVSESTGTGFTDNIITLTINENVLSTDGNNALETTYSKEFNLSK